MIREIVKYGHPALRAKGARITEITGEIRALAADMIETMHAANGVGLAAQQVGIPLQLAVVDVTGVEDRPSAMRIDQRACDVEAQMPLVLLNPELELGKTREAGIEGCLSFPEITADIVRALEIRVRAVSLEGKPLEFEAGGLLARVIQHETDHLHGILFIDRMNSATRASLAGRLKRMRRGKAV